MFDSHQVHSIVVSIESLECLLKECLEVKYELKV